MSAREAAAARGAAIERYVERIEVHLRRLGAGHDPMGHLFGIERLARASRAEWRLAERQAGRGRQQ